MESGLTCWELLFMGIYKPPTLKTLYDIFQEVPAPHISFASPHFPANFVAVTRHKAYDISICLGDKVLDLPWWQVLRCFAIDASTGTTRFQLMPRFQRADFDCDNWVRRFKLRLAFDRRAIRAKSQRRAASRIFPAWGRRDCLIFSSRLTKYRRHDTVRYKAFLAHVASKAHKIKRSFALKMLIIKLRRCWACVYNYTNASITRKHKTRSAMILPSLPRYILCGKLF